MAKGAGTPAWDLEVGEPVAPTLIGACATVPSHTWTELSPPDPGTRLLRDAVPCGGHWYAVSGRAGPDGGPSPAVGFGAS